MHTKGQQWLAGLGADEIKHLIKTADVYILHIIGQQWLAGLGE